MNKQGETAFDVASLLNNFGVAETIKNHDPTRIGNLFFIWYICLSKLLILKYIFVTNVHILVKKEGVIPLLLHRKKNFSF